MMEGLSVALAGAAGGLASALADWKNWQTTIRKVLIGLVVGFLGHSWCWEWFHKGDMTAFEAKLLAAGLLGLLGMLLIEAITKGAAAWIKDFIDRIGGRDAQDH